MERFRRAALIAVAVAVAACGSPPSSDDAAVDAGLIRDDAGASDAGEPDAGRPDAGEPDAGEPDAGEPDAGEPDAGEPDAGNPDAGDADAGAGDAGLDAGSDAGVADAGPPCTTTAAGHIVSAADGGRMLLRGLVVTPAQSYLGEVVVEGDTITCVAASCGVADVVVETNGIIFPGLIDTHNHVLFSIFDEADWTPLMAYTNVNQWPNEARYGALRAAEQHLNGESGSPVDVNCELEKYGELKGLIAGTTSIVSAATPANKACYGSIARTIDQTQNGLGADKVQAAQVFPSTATADGTCANFDDGDIDAYLIHLAEGVDQTALNQFAAMGTVTTTDFCLFSQKTTIVQGTALGGPELATMAQNGMSLVWSPRSNVTLYGAGTDLTKTANIPLALTHGVNVALGPDWSITGSQNILDELRYADQVDATVWGDVLSPQTLVNMVTTNAARVLGLQAVLGELAVGKKADLVVIAGDRCAPHAALLAARPQNVRLVMVGGEVLYGDAALQSLGPAAPGCEALEVCGTDKFICVARPGGTTTNKLGQTLVDIQSTLSGALTAYDALNLSQWDFAPIAPLARCTP